MIEVNNLTYEYPGIRALDRISFRIGKGTITALLGPNGAGKSTLLECLAGIRKPFSGNVIIDDIDIFEFPRQCNNIIGFLPSSYGLYENFTVRQNLRYFAYSHKLAKSKLESSVDYVTQKLNLQHHLNERAGNLSRGIRQRLAIGQVIIHEPKVLLLEKPTTGLDPVARELLIQMFLDYKKKGVTILITSHIFAELDQYADSLLILHNGLVVNHILSTGISKVKKQISFYVLNPPENLKEILEQYAKVKRVIINKNRVTLYFGGNETEQHELLKNLMDNGLQINEFCVVRNNIEKQYHRFTSRQVYVNS